MTTTKTTGRYEIHGIADAECKSVHEESIGGFGSKKEAEEAAADFSGHYMYGCAIVDTETGAIDFGAAPPVEDEQRAADIQCAVEYLRATQHEDGYSYRDDAARATYVSSEDDVADLGSRLREGQDDDGTIYSRWCAETDATEIESQAQTAAERAIREIARQDADGETDDSYSRHHDAERAIREWEQSARDAGDRDLVDAIQLLGVSRAARVYESARQE